MENEQLAYIGPLAPIIGGFVGASIGAFVTYYLVLVRKAVTFLVGKSEDITLPLRQEHDFIEFKIGDRTLLNLNRASVIVRNSGNGAITDFCFDIEIPGRHPHYLAKLVTNDVDLRNSVKISWDEPPESRSLFHIRTGFLNPKEGYEVVVFFDGPTDDCNILCRMEGVKCKILKQYLSFRETLREVVSRPALVFVAILWPLAFLTLAGVVKLIADLMLSKVK
jgi:hypothetical protein